MSEGIQIVAISFGVRTIDEYNTVQPLGSLILAARCPVYNFGRSSESRACSARLIFQKEKE
jgi:hypothetical protein